MRIKRTEKLGNIKQMDLSIMVIEESITINTKVHMQTNHTLNQIPRPKVMERTLKRLIFGSHLHCPECKGRSIRKVRSEHRWRCRRCNYPFTLKSASWLKGSKLPLETIWLILWCWQRRYSLQQAMDLAGISYPTAREWYSRFRDRIPSEKRQILLSGVVACDELYVKDESIIGAKQKGTRNIALKVVGADRVNRTDAINFLRDFVKVNSHLHTDGSSLYKGCGNWHKLIHTYELHKKWEFALTSEIEGVWAVFRTFVRRMYHHVTRYKLAAVVAEFCLRFRQDEIFNSPDDYWRICLSPKPFALYYPLGNVYRHMAVSPTMEKWQYLWQKQFRRKG
jgi:transposase-like protein